ncbi:MAG: hypothetical protein H0Z24_05715 [Thermosipho sp. (in: Bacteria)]|nr:hypothetical protein [Thermosipho sp. (in: thermotogales)]
MTTYDLVKEFVYGGTHGSASGNRLRIEGDKLINYSTVIAYRYKRNIILNNTKYSPTTSKHQNRVRALTPVLECDEDTLYKLINARSEKEREEVFAEIIRMNADLD